MSSTILKSALKCSRKIMIAVLNEQLKGLFSNSKTQKIPLQHENEAHKIILSEIRTISDFFMGS